MISIYFFFLIHFFIQKNQHLTRLFVKFLVNFFLLYQIWLSIFFPLTFPHNRIENISRNEEINSINILVTDVKVKTRELHTLTWDLFKTKRNDTNKKWTSLLHENFFATVFGCVIWRKAIDWPKCPLSSLFTRRFTLLAALLHCESFVVFFFK